MKKGILDHPKKTLFIRGRPNEKQQRFFDSRAKYTAYGGARGGGKSWALRRKLTALCLHYAGIRCLLIRRTYFELKSNHFTPLMKEFGTILQYRESEKQFLFPNQSTITLGYCASDRDVLRYQGQEYDIIAIDEATQLSEHQFSVLKACLRGTDAFPRRMYLTCNPGGIGHSWVKRLFIDREYHTDERAEDYCFISACVYDNPVLLQAAPDYVRQLESLPKKLKDAWLYGKWDVFEGQFFPEFRSDLHVISPSAVPNGLRYFVSFDYGFDMLAAFLIGSDRQGNLFVLREVAIPNQTLHEAGLAVAEMVRGYPVQYAVASPDLWNRRQDSGRSGFEILQPIPGMPPMRPADDRRIPGWRILREYLHENENMPFLRICDSCSLLIRSLPALLCDPDRIEDASDRPHDITHAPEALRYAVMSRQQILASERLPDRNFRFPKQENHSFSI